MGKRKAAVAKLLGSRVAWVVLHHSHCAESQSSYSLLRAAKTVILSFVFEVTLLVLVPVTVWSGKTSFCPAV